MPMGKIKITRKIKSLDIILRTPLLNVVTIKKKNL